MTKAQALQTAQQALINGNFRAVSSRQSFMDTFSTDTDQLISLGENLTHPYYWAPFIIIGNGL